MSRFASALALAAAFLFTGCATNPTHPKDPLEDFNRAVFSFNDAIDQAALKPAAELYTKLPDFVQTGVFNFFGNLNDISTAMNNMLQGKFADGLSDVMRVAVNSTLGIGGLLDIGSEAGLPKHREDFGQTLGKWGIGTGPYIVLPLLGPSTVRDTLAFPADVSVDPWSFVSPYSVRMSGTVLRALDQRAALLGASNLLEDAALDRYVFVRDAYLQRRESKVRDGESLNSRYDHDVGPTVEKARKLEADASPVQAAPSTESAARDEITQEPANPAVVSIKTAVPHNGASGTAPEQMSGQPEPAASGTTPVMEHPVSSNHMHGQLTRTAH